VSKVIVVDYNPSWPLMFDTIRAGLFPALDGVALVVEHVGSTAVPGLPAKPVRNQQRNLAFGNKTHFCKDLPIGRCRLTPGGAGVGAARPGRMQRGTGDQARASELAQGPPSWHGTRPVSTGCGQGSAATMTLR